MIVTTVHNVISVIEKLWDTGRRCEEPFPSTISSIMVVETTECQGGAVA